MSDRDIYELMSTQRAVRKLRSDPIPDEVLQRVMKAATWAPSGGNRQPWRMVIVRYPEKKAALGKLYGERWTRFSGFYRKGIEGLPADQKAKEERTIAAGDYLCEHFAEIPVIAIACFNPNLMAITDAKLNRPSVVGGGSVYPAVQNLLLACRAEGLGCVLTTLLCEVEEEVKSLLNMPEDWYTAAAVPIGYAVGQGHGPIARMPVEELFFEDEWETALSK